MCRESDRSRSPHTCLVDQRIARIGCGLGVGMSSSAARSPSRLSSAGRTNMRVGASKPSTLPVALASLGPYRHMIVLPGGQTKR